MISNLLFLDCEFTGLYQTASLISVALVGKEVSFYAEFNDYPTKSLTGWHYTHVLDNLLFNTTDTFTDTAGAHWHCKGNRSEIARQIQQFVAQFEQVEVWGDVLAYDWVFFCDLFGGSMQLPKPLHYIPADLSTLLRLRGIDPDTKREDLVKSEDIAQLKAQGLKKHNALWDAHLMYFIHQKLLGDG